MRFDLTDITIVQDRSGSMDSIRDDAEGGINAFIADQKNQPGDALLTFVEFDSEYNFVHRGVPIRDVGHYTLLPRFSTALLDAVGRAINETGARLAAIPEADRPALVVFVIATDGHENASQEFTKDKVRSMIDKQTKEFNWKFTYIGANQDAIAVAAGIGISGQAAATYAPRKSAEGYAAMSANVMRMRGVTVANCCVPEAELTMSVEQRDSMKE